MERQILNDLISWSQSPSKKPLVLKGARQVGKTWALLEFGKLYYEKKGYTCHYIDFRNSKDLFSIFEETNNPFEIINLLQFRLKTNIDIQKDLLIFDEIQECPQAISSFKYFDQSMKELDLIAAGSHLGLLKNQESFPVGKVDFLYMFPMTYKEFIKSVAHHAFIILEEWKMNHSLPAIVHNRLIELWTIYLFTGGLPEVVTTWIEESKNTMTAISKVRKVQRNLIEGYRSDFSKYSGIYSSPTCSIISIETTLSSISTLVFPPRVISSKGLSFPKYFTRTSMANFVKRTFCFSFSFNFFSNTNSWFLIEHFNLFIPKSFIEI
jgi:predicted AAA+ superfamily ATPase